ncbi:hypothetical protein [Glaciibacter psychrotolerans]|uniref:Uncharacterized protein n=1 Tax=Glaciibacter psychrotolerans TaxID=670054 RepID=A0A7Z0EHB5_9MICO|nr:hypothetical protein [Leifsonia psychrotolerans]NYJ20912.1 hypothetical protein [Leifsonia psychrotolerans]
MTSLRVHPDRLEIHLSRAEKTMSLRRDGIVVQRENIRSVTITDDPWIWIRGIRAPGLEVPLVIATGTWKFHGGKDFIAIKSKRQAVVIDLVGEEFARIIITTQHAPDLITSLKLQDVMVVDEADSSTPAAPAVSGDAPAETADADESGDADETGTGDANAAASRE